MKLMIPETIYGKYGTRDRHNSINLYGLFFLAKEKLGKYKLRKTRKSGMLLDMFVMCFREYWMSIKYDMLSNQLVMSLPKQMGRIYLALVYTKKKCVDFKKTKEEGRTRYHLNLHTDGRRAIVRWIDKSKYYNHLFFPAAKFKIDMHRCIMSGKLYPYE